MKSDVQSAKHPWLKALLIGVIVFTTLTAYEVLFPEQPTWAKLCVGGLIGWLSVAAAERILRWIDTIRRA